MCFFMIMKNSICGIFWLKFQKLHILHIKWSKCVNITFFIETRATFWPFLRFIVWKLCHMCSYVYFYSPKITRMCNYVYFKMRKSVFLCYFHWFKLHAIISPRKLPNRPISAYLAVFHYDSAYLAVFGLFEIRSIWPKHGQISRNPAK